jgi:hypothetical protein
MRVILTTFLTLDGVMQSRVRRTRIGAAVYARRMATGIFRPSLQQDHDGDLRRGGRNAAGKVYVRDLRGSLAEGSPQKIRSRRR